MSTSILRGEDDTTPCVCEDCGWTGPASDLDASISDLEDRISPGEIVPVGECPACGALAQYDPAHMPDWSAMAKLNAAEAKYAALVAEICGLVESAKGETSVLFADATLANGARQLAKRLNAATDTNSKEG